MRVARQGVAATVTLLVLVLAPHKAYPQGLTPQPPGPFTIDIRGTTLGVPQSADFYPADLPGDSIVPARGFGLEGGVHIYPWGRGSRSLGVGADVFWTRASATPTLNTPATDTGTDNSTGSGSSITGIALPDVALTMRVISPQVSVNFGSSRGWSYLTVGGGGAWVRSVAATSEQSRTVSDVNAGAGARWFITDRLGVGFDLRMHWIGGTSLFAASAGFSLKLRGSK